MDSSNKMLQQNTQIIQLTVNKQKRKCFSLNLNDLCSYLYQYIENNLSIKIIEQGAMIRLTDILIAQIKQTLFIPAIALAVWQFSNNQKYASLQLNLSLKLQYLPKMNSRNQQKILQDIVAAIINLTQTMTTQLSNINTSLVNGFNNVNNRLDNVNNRLDNVNNRFTEVVEKLDDVKLSVINGNNQLKTQVESKFTSLQKTINALEDQSAHTITHKTQLNPNTKTKFISDGDSSSGPKTKKIVKRKKKSKKQTLGMEPLRGQHKENNQNNQDGEAVYRNEKRNQEDMDQQDIQIQSKVRLQHPLVSSIVPIYNPVVNVDDLILIPEIREENLEEIHEENRAENSLGNRPNQQIVQGPEIMNFVLQNDLNLNGTSLSSGVQSQSMSSNIPFQYTFTPQFILRRQPENKQLNQRISERRQARSELENVPQNEHITGNQNDKKEQPNQENRSNDDNNQGI